ncbi:LOW QUALITY PROTEIN: dynein regulatory complex subunit 2 [Clupea harengus]|uniref:Dynein regulatory complex protein 1 n=1 Tax=Clupea harengus TaxID=7950 RepID=A0A6P8FHC6_CLUHA|nr:LOW QUALITY PROTEIN: dynein regulatory complex subunit 2 [Clupea harengus]
MPKKGGKGKQAAMTEEERLLYMQQKAQAEEEMAKRKEDMLTQFLKEKLQKEEKNSAVNLHKLTQQWRAVLRQTRATELRRDIAILSQTFERVLDRKDSVIKSLVCDLNEAEQQSAQALRAHLNCVDRLLELQKGRLAVLGLQWTSSLEELISEYNSVRTHLVTQHQQDTAYVADVTFAMEQHYVELENEARQDYQSMQDEIKNRNIEEKHALRVQLEGTVEELWGQFQQALRSYNEATEDRHVSFDALRTRDHKSAQEIDMQMRRLQKMQDSISALRVRLNSSQREGETAARGLRSAREQVTHQARQLKAQLSQARAAERNQLANLTVHSNTAAKKLQSIIAQGEKLLRLAEMCRKLETEEEKILPFYESTLSPQEQSLDKAQASEPPSEELAKVTHTHSPWVGFWQRYNKVVLERACLEQEKVGLSQENQQLRLLLRQYLEGISVSDEILRHPKPAALWCPRQTLTTATQASG